jgi:hypothetical protein
MGFIRSSVVALGAIGFVASASVASAQVRPSDSLVSAQQAAQTTPVAGRQGAKIEDANHINPALLLLILALIAGGGYALSEAISP